MKTQTKTVTLKEICREHKLCPRLSRMLLRDAIKDEKKYPNLAKHHKPRTAWMWNINSKELEEAVKILKPAPTKTVT